MINIMNKTYVFCIFPESLILSCCGLPYFTKNGDITFCCGNDSINLNKEICCEGKKIRANPKKYTCCGPEAYKPRDQICCNGIIHDKPGKCCGNQTFHPRKEICCCDNVVLPGRRRADKCCTAPNGRVSTNIITTNQQNC